MNFAYVDEYKSERTRESDDDFQRKPKKPRSALRVWQKMQDFETREEAEEYVRSRFIWKKSSAKDSLDGKKVEYRCTASKYQINECPAGLYLLYHSSNMTVSLFETACEHDNHDTDPSRLEMKHFVRSKFEDGIQKPNFALTAVTREKLPEPAKRKLISILKRLGQEKFGRPTVYAGKIHAWCNARKEIPSDEDECFVLDFFVRAESMSVDEQDLKVVLSTRRLLRNLRKSAMVQIDVTHKIIREGYPVMTLGTSDKNQDFHPFGLAVCKDETTENFSFIFKAFHTFDLEWKPTILLADGSEAITGGFQNVFGEHCFDEQWISKRSSWYEGAAPGYPSANNGLEATNAVVKSEHTLRERLPVRKFLNNVKDLLLKWSKAEDPTSLNCIRYADVRKVTLIEWIRVYQWAVKNESVAK